MASPEKNQDGQDDDADARDGSKSPALTVRPDRKTSDQRDQNEHSENCQRKHRYLLSLAGARYAVCPDRS